jgi:hypothetical protein
MKDFGNDWSVQVGSFKLPLLREWVMSETRQQVIDRSLINSRYSGASHGVKVNYTGEKIALQAAFSDGSMVWNVPWNTGPDLTRGTLPWQLSNGYALTGRVEWLLAGDFTTYADFQSWPGGDPTYVIGAAIHYQVGEYGTPVDENEILQWVVDASAELGGVNLFASFLGTHFENSTEDRDEWALMLQGGVFLNEDWEFIARYELGDLDGAGTVSDDLSVLTVGVNRYWARHALKWMADVGYGFEPVDPNWASEKTGWRADDPGGDGQFVFRTQFQILF